jgi:hypothetical protein
VNDDTKNLFFQSNESGKWTSIVQLQRLQILQAEKISILRDHFSAKSNSKKLGGYAISNGKIVRAHFVTIHSKFQTA